MSTFSWLKSLAPVLLLTTAALAADPAELKIGTGIEKYEITGASDSFKVAPNTRLYASTRINGVENGTVNVVWSKDGKEVSKTELKVPRSPYRTHAYRTFRAGDSGSWSAKLVGPDGAELGTASFTVEVSG